MPLGVDTPFIDVKAPAATMSPWNPTSAFTGPLAVPTWLTVTPSHVVTPSSGGRKGLPPKQPPITSLPPTTDSACRVRKLWNPGSTQAPFENRAMWESGVAPEDVNAPAAYTAP